ncbi:heavy metal translocatin [Daedalea quercina L-15889]|uniref:Heavy metal translocatin n=1 Tax=Daedalea quercina L-15889 TaxID=1314783 RepID=A0A165STP3_9APHY|nr:heavy metal translocatin [Daedalea quercina L-15889]
MAATSPIYALRSSRRPTTGRGPRSHMNASTNPDRDGSDVVTTIFLSNLHCSSCVHSIQNALTLLSPAPTSVDVSIVTQTVTVKHPQGLSPAVINEAIEEAGFDIVSDTEDNGPPRTPGTPITPLASLSLSHNLARLGTPFTPKKQRHLEQCAACQAEQRASLEREAESSSIAQEKRRFIDGGNIHSSEKTAISRPDSGITPAQAYPADGADSRRHVTLSIGGMTCASCSNAITHALSELPGVSDVVVNLLGNSATLNVDRADLVPTVTETVEDVGYEAEVISVEPLFVPPAPKVVHAADAEGPQRVTLSVGGMTCAACSNTVTDVLKGVSGVSDPIVNLLGASATLVAESKDIIPQVVEAIEDAGYEAEVISAEPIKSEKDTTQEIGPRTVTLRVDGMFCSHCPEKVMGAIASFGSKVTVLKPVTDHTDPIMRISYVPSPPTFTLRHIIHRISSVASPSGAPFSASLHHPPSLEDRARRMQQREQRHLLERLLFAVLAAIPTFIIGIVYMDLLPSNHPGRMWFMQPFWTGNTSRATWALFFCATPVMFYSAGTFHRRSLKEIWALWKPGSRTPVWKRFIRFGSMNLLVSTGVSVAYFASIALLALAAAQPASTSGRGDTTTYFDSVVFLTMFLLVGRFLEAYSKGRTADAITALGKLRPTSALIVVPAPEAREDRNQSPGSSTLGDVDVEKGDSSREEADLITAPGTKIERIDAELLEAGDIVRVQHGGSPPSDGTIVSGDSGAFDESSLTGESRLVKKQVGDEVFLGTINKGGVVDVRVDAIGGETMLDHVVKVVREGQTRRAPIERVADMITGYFVPVVTLLAVITWVIWLGLGLGGALPPSYLDIDVGGWVVWSLEFAIAVFVVACPCGIGLAAPTALLVGSGLAAKHGILARGGGEAFQEAARLDIVVFDKTGTLTEGGEPKVTDVEIVAQPEGSKWTRDVVLGIAAELESASSHPLATAIRQYCLDNAASSQSGSAFDETPGRGLKAEFGSLKCVAVIGNEAWMKENGCSIDGRLANQLDAWKSEGKSVVLLAIRDESAATPAFAVVGLFAIADPLRPEAKSVIGHLHDQGIGTWMISGDNETTARAVAKMVGIPETNVIAGVLPHEKADKIRWLQQVGVKKPQPSIRRLLGKQGLNERCVVAMVGDGINDAPALTAADVGIAIGSGSDVAISSAAFILVSANLYTLLTLTDLSRKVFNRVKFNFFWAMFYNTIAVPIAAGVIYPAGNARLPPAWASLLMALSSVSVVCSSLALKLYKPPALARTK